jgi:hypothetical protein
MTFQISYVYDYICRQQAQVIQNHEYVHVPNTGQGEAQQRKYKRLKRKYKRLKAGGDQVYDRSSD